MHEYEPLKRFKIEFINKKVVRYADGYNKQVLQPNPGWWIRAFVRQLADSRPFR